MAFELSALNGIRSLTTAEWQVGEGCYHSLSLSERSERMPFVAIRCHSLPQKIKSQWLIVKNQNL